MTCSLFLHVAASAAAAYAPAAAYGYEAYEGYGAAAAVAAQQAQYGGYEAGGNPYEGYFPRTLIAFCDAVTLGT
jgi:hypothetical protein